MKKSKIVLFLILFTGLIIVTYIVKANSKHSEQYLTLKNINNLTFKDFWEAPPIMDKYDAMINTGIQISKKGDSIYAETILDRYNSWALERNENLLKHEKYHAFITDYGTKVLNNLIQKKSLSLNESQHTRDSILKRLNQLQSDYDNESNHSLNTNNQIYWEYKIDSLIKTSKIDLSKKLDLDNSEVFFSKNPQKEIRLYPNRLEFVRSITRNEINMNITTSYDFDVSLNSKDYKRYLEKLKYKNIKIKPLKIIGLKALKSISNDSTNTKEIIDIIIPNKNHSYFITTSYPKNEIFRKISENFINSFILSNRKEFWVNYYNNNINQNSWKATPKNNKSVDNIVFTKNSTSDFALTYTNAFEYDNKLLIPFKPIKHDLKDIKQILAIINEKTKMSNEIDSFYQFIPIDLSILKKGKNHIQIGYIPKEKDSLDEFHHFYSTHIYYNKKN